MSHFYRTVCSAALFALLSGSARAEVVGIGLGDFSGSEIVIGFDGFVPGSPITADYLSSGVVFGFGLFAGADPGSATNAWGPFLTLPITAEFLSPVIRTGFEIAGQDGDVAVLSAFDANGALLGDAFFQIGSASSFIGIEDLNGISKLWINDQSFDGSFLLRNMRVEAPAVPEPGSCFLIFSGIAGLWLRKRRNARSAHQEGAR